MARLIRLLADIEDYIGWTTLARLHWPDYNGQTNLSLNKWGGLHWLDYIDQTNLAIIWDYFDQTKLTCTTCYIGLNGLWDYFGFFGTKWSLD